MDIDSYEVYWESVSQFHQNAIPNLELGELTVDETLDEFERLEEIAVRNADIISSSFQGIIDYYNIHFQYLSGDREDRNLKTILDIFEKDVDIADRYGLELIYGLISINDPDCETPDDPIEFSPFTTNNFVEIARANKWNKEKILIYFRDIDESYQSLGKMDNSEPIH